MANRNFHQFRGALEKKVIDLYFQIDFATGAASIVRAKGLTSVTKNGTGTYDFVLSDKYNKLLAADFTFLDGSAVPLTCFNYVKTQNVAGGLLTAVFADAAKSAADPADTSHLYMHLALSNSDAL